MTYGRIALLVACCLSAACVGSRANADTPEGYDEAREIVRRLDADPKSEEAFDAAVEAIASRLGGESGRHRLVTAIARHGLEYRFGNTMQWRINEEIRAEQQMARWRKSQTESATTGDAPPPPPETDPLEALPDPEVAPALVAAARQLQREGGPKEVVNPGSVGRWCRYYCYERKDTETFLPIAELACADPDDWRRTQACFAILKVLRDVGSDAWTPQCQAIALMAVRTIAKTKPRGTTYLEIAVSKKVCSLEVRLEGLAGLRRYWPDYAQGTAAKMAAEERTEADILELERILVEGDSVGVRSEALLLLAASGKTADVEARLKERLEPIATVVAPRPEHAGNKRIRRDSETRARIEFALRLLNGGKP